MVNCPHLAETVRPEIARLDRAFALHDDQAGQIRDIFGMDPARVDVIGSGYNARMFNTEGRKPYESGGPVRLCYAGKISRPKGVPEMLDALELLSGDPDMPGFSLAMAGGCQDEALAGRLDSLPPYIRYLGQIPQDMLAELMKSSDVFVLPSYFEGLPLVLIEAMASGALPVSTDLPGVREWIDSNVGCPNVRYVAMPSMKSIDEPEDEARAGFAAELARVLKKAVIDIASGEAPGPLPDSSSITWDSVAGRVLKFFL
jgi:glycosyltransferase involved in cell wall biosynthesis